MLGLAPHQACQPLSSFRSCHCQCCPSCPKSSSLSCPVVCALRRALRPSLPQNVLSPLHPATVPLVSGRDRACNWLGFGNTVEWMLGVAAVEVQSLLERSGFCRRTSEGILVVGLDVGHAFAFALKCSGRLRLRGVQPLPRAPQLQSH